MNILDLTPGQLKRAAEIKEEIESLHSQLAKIASGKIPSSFVRKGKHRMSAAGRLAIAAAQKARWAKLKTAKSKPSGKRKMSPAAKAKIAAAAKARWAKAKAVGKKSL